MNADEILTMPEKDSLVLIAGKYPIKVKKAIQFELFPGLVDEYEVSQMDYKRKTSDVAKEAYEKEVASYEAIMDQLEEENYLDEDQEIEAQYAAENEQDEVLEQAREEIEMYQNSLSVLEAMSEEDDLKQAK